MIDVKVGDSVRLFDVNGKRAGMPEGGWPGTVVKVGRKLVTITRDAFDWDKGSVYRLEDGFTNDVYRHGWFKTLAQAAEDVRRTEAVDTLRQRGIEVRSALQFTTEQLEAIVKIVDEPGKAC